MDRNHMAVPIQPAAEQPKKSVQELENPEVKGRVFIQAKDLYFKWLQDVTDTNVGEIKLPETSGFRMSRKV